MVGYSRAEVMQKSCTCSFMYGDQTDREVIKQIESALENYQIEQVEIRLYKKNSMDLKIFFIKNNSKLKKNFQK